MAETKGKKNIFQFIIKLLSYIVISFVCLITLFLLYYIVTSQIHAKDENYRPGVSIYTIVSPSMTPVIKVYDIVVNIKASSPKSIEIGDIITYKSKAPNSDGMTITHRVVAIDKTQDGKYEYMTQGDNNSEPDSLMVTYDQVIGKEIMIIPKVGKLQFLIANQKGWLLLLLIPIGLYLIREFVKLINLLTLKKKVARVVGEQEVIKPDYKVVEERKEQIKTNLKNSQTAKDSLVKSEKEPTSFLEQYTETKVEVKTNKYAELIAKKKQEETKKEEVKEEIKEETKVEKEKIILPKMKEEINDEYEILDTDELTTKIKEYDTKIIKLNKMIDDIENIKEEQPVTVAFTEVDDFLKGGRIKVKNIEETKNKKRKVTSKRATEPSKYNQEVIIELSPLVGNSNYNPRTKIARPESVDIQELRTNAPKNNAKKTKKQLNLNPKKVTSVKKDKNTTTKKSTSSKKKLELNPKTTQRATRNRTTIRQKSNIEVPNTQQIQTVNQNIKKNPRKKEPLIIIEKVR